MARVLEPERLKLILDQYASAFGLRKISEVELLARRTAAAKAGTKKPDAATATAVSDAPAQQGRAAGGGLARSAISEAEYVEQSQRWEVSCCLCFCFCCSLYESCQDLDSIQCLHAPQAPFLLVMSVLLHHKSWLGAASATANPEQPPASLYAAKLMTAYYLLHLPPG